MTQQRPHREGARSEAGFTLVEALVAIVILVFGLIAVANLFVVAATSNSVANQSTGAATIASQRMDMLRATSYDVLFAARGGDVDSDAPGFNQDDDVNGVARIHTRWAVASVAGDPSTLFIQVRSEGRGPLAGPRSRSEFTVFRSCPTPGTPPCP